MAVPSAARSASSPKAAVKNFTAVSTNTFRIPYSTPTPGFEITTSSTTTTRITRRHLRQIMSGTLPLTSLVATSTAPLHSACSSQGQGILSLLGSIRTLQPDTDECGDRAQSRLSHRRLQFAAHRRNQTLPQGSEVPARLQCYGRRPRLLSRQHPSAEPSEPEWRR